MQSLLQRLLVPSVQLEWFSQIITYANELIHSCLAAVTPHLWWSTNMSYSWTLIILESSPGLILWDKHYICYSNQLLSLTPSGEKANSHLRLLHHTVAGISDPTVFWASNAGRLLLLMSPHRRSPQSIFQVPGWWLISPKSFYNCSSSTASTFYLSVLEAFGDFIITKCPIINKLKITFHSIHFHQHAWNFISFLSYFEGSVLYEPLTDKQCLDGSRSFISNKL